MKRRVVQTCIGTSQGYNDAIFSFVFDLATVEQRGRMRHSLLKDDRLYARTVRLAEALEPWRTNTWR